MKNISKLILKNISDALKDLRIGFKIMFIYNIIMLYTMYKQYVLFLFFLKTLLVATFNFVVVKIVIY